MSSGDIFLPQSVMSYSLPCSPKPRTSLFAYNYPNPLSLKTFLIKTRQCTTVQNADLRYKVYLLDVKILSSLNSHLLQELCKNVMSEMNMNDFVVCYGETRIIEVMIEN